jgi:TolA-binding protein
LAQEKQKKVKSDKLPSDVIKYYNKAIEKSWKLIDFYSDSSKYADDALLLIGKSHYHLAEYSKAERVLQQFLLKYIGSNLIPEAKLWLAKTYIQIEKEDEALEELNKLFEDKVSNKIAGEALYNLGDLYFKQENFEKAIENLQKCAEISSDEEVVGSAQFLIGESFYNLKEYESAIFNYDKITKLNVPPLMEFEASMQKVNALNELGKYDKSETTLKVMLRDQRFKPQFSLIETELAKIYELQGNIQFANESYLDVIKKYPKSEGAALSSFYLGQLFEFELGRFDSAKVYYENVKRHYSKSEAVEEASKKAGVLSEYLKIKSKIIKDKNDLFRLSVGDSSLVDSVEIQSDSVLTQIDSLNSELSKNEENLKNNYEDDGSDNIKDKDFPDNNQEQENAKYHTDSKKAKQKKVAVSRQPEEVGESLLKNSFAIAEFFLVKYQQYDSAEVSYNNFINNFTDSLLTPKAYFSLFYIYKNIKNDEAAADSIKAIILNQYPETVYGRKLSSKDKDLRINEVSNKNDAKIKSQYIEAENLLMSHKYHKAIKLYNEIALQDSGSIWAQKSRYSVAYIYEKYLNDISKAIDSYTILAKEYPNTEFSKIADNKIKEPKKEPESIPEDDDEAAEEAEESEEEKEESTINESEQKNKPVIEDERETPDKEKPPIEDIEKKSEKNLEEDDKNEDKNNIEQQPVKESEIEK